MALNNGIDIAGTVSALADGDPEKARDIAERHVLDAGRSLASRLEQTRDR